MAKSPVVTGISPKEGPPGTRVTIRGEHLGINPNDISSNSNKNIILKSICSNIRINYRFEDM